MPAWGGVITKLGNVAAIVILAAGLVSVGMHSRMRTGSRVFAMACHCLSGICKLEIESLFANATMDTRGWLVHAPFANLRSIQKALRLVWSHVRDAVNAWLVNVYVFRALKEQIVQLKKVLEF